MQDRVAQALQARARHAQGALQLETLEARPVFDDGDARRSAPGHEEPRQGADRGLHDRRQRRRRRRSSSSKGFPSLRRVLRTPQALGPHRRAGAQSSGDAAAGGAGRRGARCVPARAPARPIPARFPDLSLSVVKLLGSGEYALELPGQPRRRALRAGREGLHAFDRAQPPLSRPHHAAPAEGGARRAARSPYSQRRAARRSPRTARVQEDNAAKVERQVAKSAAALLLASRIGAHVRRHRDRRIGQGNVGAHLASDRRRPRRARLRGPRRRRPRARPARAHRRRRAASSTSRRATESHERERSDRARRSPTRTRRSSTATTRGRCASSPNTWSRCTRFEREHVCDTDRVLRLGAARARRSARPLLRRGARARAPGHRLVEEPARATCAATSSARAAAAASWRPPTAARPTRAARRSASTSACRTSSGRTRTSRRS